MKFRIIAVPLAVSKKSLSRLPNDTGKAATLVYYHFQTFPTTTNDTKPANVFRRVVDKAVRAWASMGKSPEGNWKVGRTF